MQLKELMTKKVHTIEADATIRTAAEQMAELDIGVLPVTENNQVIGVLTDRDIVVRAIAEGLDPKQTNVRGTMTGAAESTSSETSVEDAIRIMETKQIRRLVVADDDGNLQGIVSLGDLATKCEDKSTPAEVLESVSKESPNV